MPRRKINQTWAIRSIGGDYCDSDWGVGKASVRRRNFSKTLQEVRDKPLEYPGKECSVWREASSVRALREQPHWVFQKQ